MSHVTVSAKAYVATWLGLLGLTLLTSLLGLINTGQYDILIAVVIALMKASLIACFFMHAIYESKLVRIVLAGGLLWFAILFTLTLTDYFTRGLLPFPGK